MKIDAQEELESTIFFEEYSDYDVELRKAIMKLVKLPAKKIENDCSDGKAVPFSDLARDEIGVIGNIHENGDLLK